MSCVNSSSLFLSQKREVNTVLADIIKHMTPDRAFEDAYPQVTGSLAPPVFVSNQPCRPHTVSGLAAAVGDPEDPRILPQLLSPLLHGGFLAASPDKTFSF